MTRIVFLGTGGGRFSAITQTRATGGIFINDGPNIHLDPGPGALVHLCNKGIDPTRLDGVFVSHCHPDHYNDAEILVEAMTRGGNSRKGVLAGSVSVIHGAEGFSPAISPYHQKKLDDVRTLRPGDEFNIRNTRVIATPATHSDPSTVGFKFMTRGGQISYTSDTAMDSDVVEAHRGARVLIMSVTRPLGYPIPHHLETGDALDFVGAVKPELAIFTHLGMKFGNGIAEKEALLVQNNTGVRTVAAEDGMEIGLGREIEIKS